MKEVRISLEDALYERAEKLAAERGVTLDQLLRDYLRTQTRFGGETDEAYRARMELVAMARASRRGMIGPWNREEAYAERLSRYERPDLRGDGAGDGAREVAKGGGDHGEQ